MDLQKSKKIKVLELAFGKGFVSHHESDLTIRCPSCRDSRTTKQKLSVKLDNGWYHCWVCGTSGKNILYLFRKYAPDFLSRIEPLYPNSKISRNSDEPTPLPVVSLPDDIRLVAEHHVKPDDRAVFDYLVSRGLTTLDMYRWRICVSDDFKFRRKAIIPSYDDDGVLNYYTARCIDESKFKYRNAATKKSDVIFNEVDVDWKKPVLLVEGVFDAMKCPENTIPALGCSLPTTGALYKSLKKNKCTVVVAFDAEATTRSHVACKKLQLAGCDVYVSFVHGDDLGSKTKEDVRKILKNLRPWTNELRINHKIADIKSGSIL